MDLLTLLVYVFSFATLYTLVEGVYYSVVQRRVAANRQLNERLRRFARRLQAADAEAEASILIGLEVDRTFVQRLSHILPRRQGLGLLLYRAGMPMSLPQFTGLSLGLALAGIFWGSTIVGDLRMAALGTTFGLLPFAFIYYKKRKRMEAFELQFADAMELLSRSLRAGHSLRFGFQMIGDEMEDPMGTEFAQLAHEISLGMETRAALNNLAYRMSTNDMPFFINAVTIQRETGGNLALILDNLAQVVRDRIKFYGKARSLLAQVKLTANILAMVPIVLVGVIQLVNPEYSGILFETELGRMLLGTALALIAVGYGIIRRMAVVKL